MGKITRIGVDTSKGIFQLHGVDEADQPVLRRTLKRREVLTYFGRIEPTVIGMEACGGSHFWARELRKLGHEVVLLAAQYVKPYVKRGKHDKADAEAICEAMSRPTMRFVPVKTADQQAVLMLAGVRERLVASLTQLTNSIRGYAAEFGVVAPRGLDEIGPLLERIADGEGLPQLARDLFADLAVEVAALQARIRTAEARLSAWLRQDQTAQRLMQIPGVGPVGATLLVLKTPEPHGFKCGRDFAAWIGLTPKNHSTAGRNRLGVITKAGDERLRSVLVSGAMAMVKLALRGAKTSPWLAELLKRKPAKHAAVALANKIARIAWKLMVTGADYGLDAQSA